jgi:hypothetical protein
MISPGAHFVADKRDHAESSSTIWVGNLPIRLVAFAPYGVARRFRNVSAAADLIPFASIKDVDGRDKPGHDVDS